MIKSFYSHSTWLGVELEVSHLCQLNGPHNIEDVEFLYPDFNC